MFGVFFALLGQRGNSSARLGREAKTNNLQQNEAEPLRTKAADVNFGQEVRGFCVKRKYVTRSTGRKLHGDGRAFARKRNAANTSITSTRRSWKTRGRSSSFESAVRTRSRRLQRKEIREEDDNIADPARL